MFILPAFFFAQSVHIKLALSQGVQLSIFLEGKSVVLHLHKGPD